MAILEKTLNVRLPESTYTRLKALTESTGRTQSWLAVEALEAYLDQQSWQIREVNSAIIEADKSEFATDTEITTILKKYAN